MSRAIAALVALRLVLSPALSMAEPAPTKTLPGTMAFGISLGLLQRRDFGASDRGIFVPELVGLLYRPTNWAGYDQAYWRFGARLGYVGLEQPEFPAGLALHEFDIRALAEGGLVYDGLLIPSVALGLGMHYRRASFRSELPLNISALDYSEVQPIAFIQVGLGIPLLRGRIVVEPTLRYERIRRDARSTTLFAIDITYEL